MTRSTFQRRLAAVMMADVVGFSRLIEADETGTLTFLKDLHRGIIEPVIREHEGRIVKLMGDGLLVEFVSAVSAVEAALALQEKMTEANADLDDARRIVFRIGINVGDVIGEGSDIYGDDVNIAARLEALARPGGICVSRSVRDQISAHVPCRFEEIGTQRLKNIGRPIQCFHIIPSEGERATLPIGYSRDERRLSIVVLPFENMSGDQEQGYLADGLTEDIGTDLSRIAGSFVIARSTAFTYKGKAFDAKKVAQELGVRYVLEGSVRRGGHQVRINVQLIDGETGAQLWAERFDRPLGDLLVIQDEITQRVAQELSLKLVDIESQSSRRRRPTHPDALDLVMHGWSVLNQPSSKSRTIEARKLFEASLKQDENETSSLIGLAMVMVIRAERLWSEDPEQEIQEADALIERAMRLDPNIGAAYRVKSWLLGYRGRLPEAIAAAERALELNRNDTLAHQLLALFVLQSGHAVRSRELIEHAMRLSPRDPNEYRSLHILARAEIALNEPDRALAHLQQAVIANSDEHFIRLFFATAHGRAGREKEARQAIAEFLKLQPDLLKSQSTDAQTLMRAQLELAVRGYYLGTVDGRAGAFTRRALSELQRDSGLPPTSELDVPTLLELKLNDTGGTN